MTSLPLAILGFVTVIVMLILIMTKKASPLVALIAVPVVTGIIACFFIADAETGVVDFITNFKSLGGMITGAKGIGSVAATGVMFIFSILFFGILTDAGTFRPIIRTVLNLVGTDPIKIAIGTAVLAAIVHLDGSGAVTFLICVPAHCKKAAGKAREADENPADTFRHVNKGVESYEYHTHGA